ncbi:MAG TPA: hypothetical protein VI758_07790, partial [Bacteroidota bacterium]
MINKRYSCIYAVCIIGLMFLPACLEVHTTSQVNSDGSILRTITFEDDSASVYRGVFPLPI